MQVQGILSGSGVDEVDGLGREDVRGVVGGGGSVRLLYAVVGDAVVVVLRFGMEGEPTVPSGWDVGSGCGVVAVQVLPDERGPVPSCIQPRRDRRRVIEDRPAAEIAAVSPNPRRVRVVPRQRRSSRWTTEGVRDECVGERHSLGGELGVHGRHVAQGVPPLIVGHDDDDVRRGLSASSGCEDGACNQHGDDQRPQREKDEAERRGAHRNSPRTNHRWSPIPRGGEV